MIRRRMAFEKDSLNLYRGKRQDNNEWIYGFYYKDIWGDDSEYITYDCENYEIIPHTVGKCTGFPDCYQGDILQCPSGDEIGVVRYGEYNNSDDFPNTDHIGFYVEWISGRDKDLLRNDLGYWLKFALIIGNVVDNPELLPESANQTE